MAHDVGYPSFLAFPGASRSCSGDEVMPVVDRAPPPRPRVGLPAEPARRIPHGGPRRCLLPCLLLPLLLVLGGCVGTEQDTSDAAPPTAVSDTTALARSAPGEPPADAEEDGRPLLALEGEGLRIFDPNSGSARPIPFGTPAAEVLRIVEALRGGPPREDGESPECGGSFATWEGGPTLRCRGGRFVGWSVRDPGLSTAAGVEVGSTREELESVHAVQVARTSLGVEFSAGGLAGVLEGEGGEDRVVALWAGEACLAR